LRRPIVGFLVLVVTLAFVQLYQLRNTMPSPDGVAYFEVADQIHQVGYAAALPIHWSPLYPLYVLAGRAVAGSGLDRELLRTAVGDAVLLVVLCVTVLVAFHSLARLCWPETPLARHAWLAYACGLALFFSFAMLRVGLRMPDALVTSFVVATLWAWCQSIARRLDLRWCALAGVLSGLAFLTRGNLLHWSLAAGVVACASAPAVTPRRRVAAYAVFCLGLAVLFAPQTYALSSARGHFTFGETGKIVFAPSYGAEYEAGFPAWPVRLNAGDVRIFTDDRDLNFPGFYDIGREFEDAKVFQNWWRMPWAVVRSVDNCLFGTWSPAFALLWPLLWAVWPIALFEIWPRSALADHDAPANPRVRRRLAWFLMLGGSAGVAMHLVSFCNAYYMPPYLLAFLTGACLRLLDSEDGSAARRRAAWLVAGGFAIVTALSTVHHFRSSERRARTADLHEAQALSAALAPIAAAPGGLRKIAVAGNWLALYGVRLSRSQVVADLPEAAVLHDRARRAAAIVALRERGVVALLIDRTELRPDDLLMPAAMTSRWAVLDLRISLAASASAREP
jgi:4-amino-4-deoxy-L-arabinose transferase-like glycosyltransferase